MEMKMKNFICIYMKILLLMIMNKNIHNIYKIQLIIMIILKKKKIYMKLIHNKKKIQQKYFMTPMYFKMINIKVYIQDI